MRVKKNICLTLNSLANGGAEKQCLLLAKELGSHYNVHLIIVYRNPVNPKHLSFINREGIQYVFLGNSFIKKFQEFVELIKHLKIDIIFSFLPTDTLFAAICGKFTNAPYIFGGIRNSRMNIIKYYLIKLANNYLIDYTITNNHSAYFSSIRFGFKENLIVVPNGIEIRPVLERGIKDKDPITIVTVARFVKQKDYITALKSISLLKKNLKSSYSFKYKIIGHGPRQEVIENYINRYGLSDVVELIVQPSSNIYEILDVSDIYLCTSIFEGTSNAIMEAMNCSLPIVATNAGDNSRLVISESNGFVTEIKDFEKIAYSLERLIKSKKLRKKMGMSSHEHLKRNYSLQIFKERYVYIIENLEILNVNKGIVQQEDKI